MVLSILISNENFYYLLEKQNKEYFMNFFSSFVYLKFVKTCNEPCPSFGDWNGDREVELTRGLREEDFGRDRLRVRLR